MVFIGRVATRALMLVLLTGEVLSFLQPSVASRVVGKYQPRLHSVNEAIVAKTAKIAKALGITVPPSLLLRADQVIK